MPQASNGLWWGSRLASLLLLLLMSTVFFAAESTKQDDGTHDVCILGAGSSGMSLAFMLKDRNYDVLVIEKEDYVGGHCNTQRFTGPDGQTAWDDAGVTVFPNTSLANELGLGPWNIDLIGLFQRFAGPNSIIPSVFADTVPFEANLMTGENFGEYIPSFNPLDFFVALQRLRYLANTTYRWTDTMIDSPTRIPPELTVPFSQWVVANNFTILGPIFNGTLYAGGYGPLSDITAFDAILQAGTSTSLMYDAVPGSWFSVFNGCQSIYDGITAYLGQDRIKLNSRVLEVSRPYRGSNQPVVLTGIQNGKRFTERCGQLVVAFPPTPRNIAFLNPTLIEQAVFGSVTVRDLLLTHVDLAGPLTETGTGFTIINTNPAQPFDEQTLPAVLSISRPFFTFGPGHINALADPGIPENQLKQVMATDAAAVPPALLTNVSFNYRYFLHEYNPHFSARVLDGPISPYLAIDEIQGHQKTFWVGAVRTTANTASIWNYNSVLVERYFPVKH